MFAQIIRGKVSDRDAVRPVVQRWMTDLGPTATGWLGSTGGVTEQGELFVLVRFESAEAARRNSDRPEQGQWWLEMEKLLDGEAIFQDTSEVYQDVRGAMDSAGFVQVMIGQSSDPERAKQLMAETAPARVSGRPDIIGQFVAGHGDGKFTMVNYFSSEAAAREGERKPIPPELQEAAEEMMSLSVGTPEFLDLNDPWLDSPK